MQIPIEMAFWEILEYPSQVHLAWQYFPVCLLLLWKI